MPEGDTVWLAARRLDGALADRVLTVSDFRVPQLATVDLRGRRVIGVVSRGKHLLTRIEGDLTLHTHLRMDGTWRLFQVGDRRRGGPAFQIRIVLANREWRAVGFRLPVVELLPTGREEQVVGHLGPDLLASDWNEATLAEAAARLRTDATREIGDALIDQRNVAGIGNLYKAEACFLAGISPFAPVGDVADLAGLVEVARDLLDRNKERTAQSSTGDLRRGHQHYVFERTGWPCRRCGATDHPVAQGMPPRERLTYWCPRCQPLPEGRALPEPGG